MEKRPTNEVVVSIVIPVRPDEPAVSELLAQLPDRPGVQLIVVVGGAPSGRISTLRASRDDVLWTEASGGRGPQLNAGAARAIGRWLWFVHADSRLPRDWLDVFRNLDTSFNEVVGGSFAFRLDSRAWQARVLECGVRWRVRWCGLPYGDQGIFVRRAVFARMGGFAPLPLMEDVDFVKRLKREGPVRHLTSAITTSARRWEQRGWWRQSAANLGFLGLYWLGVSPERLARRYDRTGP